RTGGGPRGTAARQIVLVVAYFRLAAAVRSNLPVTTNVALHQLEPSPAGLIGVKSPVNRAVWSLVNARRNRSGALLGKGTANTVTASARRARLRSSGDSAHCSKCCALAMT